MSATNREGRGVGSRVGSGRVRHCVGRVGSDNWLLKSGRVGSGPDPGGSGRVRKIGPGNNSGWNTNIIKIEQAEQPEEKNLAHILGGKMTYLQIRIHIKLHSNHTII